MAANRNVKSGNPLFKGEWNNNTCIAIAHSESFPACVKDINVQKNIINRYYNFYLGGKPQKGLTVADLAFAVISIMPLHEETEKFLWQDLHYNESGKMFFLTPEDKVKAEVENIRINEEKLPENEKVPPNNIKIKKEENKGSEDKQQLDEDIKTKETYENSADVNIPENVEGKKLETVSSEIPEKNTINIEHRPSFSGESSSQQCNENISFKLPSDIQWYARAPKRKELEIDPPEYGPVQNSAFVASCNKLLAEWDANQKARIVLKYFFGIVALTLMRSTTKKYPHLVNTFAGKKFLSTITFTKNYLQYSVPNKKCFKNSYRTFKRRDGNIPFMFAKFVVESFHIDALRRDQKKYQNVGFKLSLNIFKMTVLSHTADYGFGLISMLSNIQDVIGVEELDRISAVTYCDRTAESWKRIKNFLEVYMVKTSKEGTHHWARIISTEFFKDLSCNANYELSVILGVFIENITSNKDVWKSAWVKSGQQESGDNLWKLKDLGVNMYEKFKSVEKEKEEESKVTKQNETLKENNQIFTNMDFEDNLFEFDNESHSAFEDFLFDFNNDSHSGFEDYLDFSNESNDFENSLYDF